METMNSMEEEHVLLTSINQNPNLGLYVYATDKYALVGKGLPQHFIAELKKVLKVPCHEISIAGTDMAGVFLAGNSNCLLVPPILFPFELAFLKKHGINFHILETDLTCLGNNILCNDHHAYISPDFTEKELKKIEELLNVPVVKKKLASIPTIGAMAVMNTKGMVVNNNISDEEAEELEHDFKVKVTGGTVNKGNPFLRAGIACNSFGFAIGSQSGSPEVINADEALGFME